ncbi:hypothetical protein [Hydrogenovibrio halophilus]|uniref:hypothetical protein n=1 Tax=Hydrogenovibrio halophilus TaxID=373391 RepID=UPI00037FF9E0|nr:hypothetical protein [Hydrogenovibrio halophilus]
MTNSSKQAFSGPDNIIETQADQAYPDQFSPVTEAQPDGHKPPLEWIRLELHPLPGTDHVQKVIFWNPETQELVGEGAETVAELAAKAKADGHIQSPSLNHMEMTDPLSKPSELAAVLAQHYWAIPEPVAQPGDPKQTDSETLH